MKLLDGKSALITGAASGIGQASALLFAENGAKLILVDRAEGVEDTAKSVRAQGGAAIALSGDAADETFIADAVSRARKEYGRLDACFANAGISGGATTFFDLTPEIWSEILRVNLIGVFLAVKHAAKVMIEQKKGSIICTASVAALRSGAGGSPYSASKAGVISLVQTAANQFYGAGVRINAICPGLIETGMTKPLFDMAKSRGTQAKVGQLNPLTRAGVPIEIAQMAMFLASDAASYVNGQAMVVDGGLSSSHPVASRRALY